MPNVNGREFPYTAKGIKDAEKAAELKKRKAKMETFKKRYKATQEKLGPAKGKPQAKTAKPSKRTTTAKKLKGY
jgi:hypothetical protein